MLLKYLDWSFIQFLDRLDWINRKFSGTSLKEETLPTLDVLEWGEFCLENQGVLSPY